MICFLLSDSSFKTSESLDTAKEQGICPQINADEHG